MSSLSNKKIAIVDYQLGNLFSVKKACLLFGVDAVITSDPKEIEAADAIILPGVGAFNEAMQNLKALQLIAPIKSFVESGKPMLGICLGLQLLGKESEEFSGGSGLGIIDATIKKFPTQVENKKISVPHISWNTIYNTSEIWGNSVLRSLKQNEFMYFVHSYFLSCNDKSVELCRTNYEGMEFVSGIKKDNVTAFQFHPEKSGVEGLKIYENWFLDID